MRRRRGRRLVRLLLVPLILATALEAVADEPPRLVVLPFEMHADRDLLFLQEGIVDMLTSRLSAEAKIVLISQKAVIQAIKETGLPESDTDARAIGARLHADYVLFGNLTVSGDVVSLYSKMLNLREEGSALTFVEQGDTLDDVIPEISLFAAKSYEKILGYPLPAETKPGQAVPMPSHRSNKYAHPESLLTTESEEEDEASPSGPPSAVTRSEPEKVLPARPDKDAHPETLLADKTTDDEEVSGSEVTLHMTGGSVAEGGAGSADRMSTFWASDEIKADLQGIALGDVNGDGRTEIVAVDDCRVSIHRFESRRLVKIWEQEGRGRGRCIGVDVGDMNGNGPAEIFVTRLKVRGGRLDSFVLEWDGRDFQPISEGEPWYYRIADLPAHGKILLGQKRTMEAPFAEGPYQLRWENGRYEPQALLALPTGVNVYGFTQGDVMNDGGQVTLAFDSEDHLRIFSQSGRETWQSPDRYGGSMNYVESWSRDDDLPDRLYLPQRIYVGDLDGDGKHEVVVPSNRGRVGRFFPGLRNFTSSYVSFLSWEHDGLVLTRQTPELSGYISDYGIGDFDNDGSDEVVVAHVSKGRLPLFSRSKTAIVAYEISQTSSVRQ